MACRTCRALGSSDRCKADANSASACAALMPRRFLVVGIAGLPGWLALPTTSRGYDKFGSPGTAPGLRRAGGNFPSRRGPGHSIQVGSVALLAAGPAALPAVVMARSGPHWSADPQPRDRAPRE